MVGMTLKSRHINLPQCRTLLGEMTNMTTIVACAWNHALFYDGGHNTVGGGAIALGTIF
jgi:hypothetical protein